MRQLGWDVRNPVIRGKFEYAIRGHPIVAHLPKDSVVSDGDIEVDTSYGEPEAEMKEVSDWEKVQIFANMPSEILSLRDRATTADSRLETAARALVTHQTRLDSLDLTLDRVIGFRRSRSLHCSCCRGTALGPDEDEDVRDRSTCLTYDGTDFTGNKYKFDAAEAHQVLLSGHRIHQILRRQ